MSLRSASLALLAPLLLAGCRLYDSAALKVSLEAPHGTQVQVRLPVIPHAPRRVEAVRLVLDGQELPGSFEVGLEVDIDVSALAEGPGHWLQGIAAYGAETVRSEPIVFTVDRTPPAIAWSPPPGTLAIAPSQLLRATFSEPLGRQAVPWATSCAGYACSPAAVSVAADRMSADVVLPWNADAADVLDVRVSGVVDAAGNSAPTRVLRYTNVPFSVDLACEGCLPFTTGPTALQATVTGATPATTVELRYGYDSGTTINPSLHVLPDVAPPYRVPFDPAGAEGRYEFTAVATNGNRVKQSQLLTFWYVRTPPALQECIATETGDLQSLWVHEQIRCRYSRPVMEPAMDFALPGVPLLDGAGRPVPSVAHLESWNSNVVLLDRLDGSGAPGSGSIVLSGLRDITGLALPDAVIPVRWPVWQVPGAGRGLGIAADPRIAVTCGGAYFATFWAPLHIGATATTGATTSLNELTFEWSSTVWSGGSRGLGSEPVSAPAAARDLLAWARPSPWPTVPGRVVDVFGVGMPRTFGGDVDDPAAAADPSSADTFLAYRDGGTVVVKRISVGTDPSPVGSPISTGGTPGALSLAVAPGGAAAVAWPEAGAIRVWSMGATDWAAVGPPLAGPGGAPSGAPSLGILPGGDPVVAYETLVGGVPSVLVSRWTGTAWTTVGTPLNTDPLAAADGPSLAVDPAGSVVVALAEADAAGRTVRVKSFEGGNWVLDGGEVPGVPCTSACIPALAVCGHGLRFVAWSDGAAGIRAYRLNRW